jgi:hypothetical protein
MVSVMSANKAPLLALQKEQSSGLMIAVGKTEKPTRITASGNKYHREPMIV